MSVYPTLLALHLTAFILMAGTTLLDFINYRTFWRLVNNQREQAAGILAAKRIYSVFAGLGPALLIASGTGTVILHHGLPETQLWFRIKMFLVLLLVANGIVIGRRLDKKLRNAFRAEPEATTADVGNIKGKLQRYYLVQLGIFLLIVVLSTYKFT